MRTSLRVVCFRKVRSPGTLTRCRQATDLGLSALWSCVPPTPGPKVPPGEAEHSDGVRPQADAPTYQRPVEPPSSACEQVDHEQADVDHDVDGCVSVEALEGLDAGVRSLVALLIISVHGRLLPCVARQGSLPVRSSLSLLHYYLACSSSPEGGPVAVLLRPHAA